MNELAIEKSMVIIHKRFIDLGCAIRHIYRLLKWMVYDKKFLLNSLFFSFQSNLFLESEEILLQVATDLHKWS